MNSKVKMSGFALLAACCLLTSSPGMAQSATPGVTATEIKFGQTNPYSGPVSAYGTIGRAQSAFFDKINAEGGINGRKLTLISLDDGYSPPKTVEQTRKLVEQEGVAFIFDSIGTAPNRATAKYLNSRKVPHLFAGVTAAGFADPVNLPWIIGFQPTLDVEARIIGRHIMQNKPTAKIGVLYQNDDVGKTFLEAFKNVLGEKAKSMIVGEVSYEVSDATVDSQVTSLKASGADTFVNIATPKFASQAIRRMADLSWKPQQYLFGSSSSVTQVLKPAGLENSIGALSAQFYKDPTDPKWANDPAMIAWRQFMTKYYPQGDQNDSNNVHAINFAEALVQTLRQCGNDLSRENIMKQALNLKNLKLPLLLPGITVNTSPTNYHPIRQMQMMRFDGVRWALIGDVISDQ